MHSTNNDNTAQLSKTRQEGRALLKAETNLSIEYDNLERQIQQDVNLIEFCVQNIQQARDADIDAESWAIQMSLHQKASEAIRTRLEACISERISISQKLDAPTFGYPTLRQFLAAHNLEDMRRYKQTANELDEQSTQMHVSDSSFPPLEHIFSNASHRKHASRPRNFGQARSSIDAGSSHGGLRAASSRPLYQDFRPSVPSVSRPPTMATALEAIASDLLPHDVYQITKDMRNLIPDISRANNPFDAPHRHLRDAKTVLENAIRDIRKLPSFLPIPPPSLPPSRQSPQPSTQSERYVFNPFLEDMSNDHYIHAGPDPEPDHERVLQELTEEEHSGAERYRADHLLRSRFLQSQSRPSIPQSRPPIDVSNQYRHTNICCDVCQEGIRGIRYKCKVSHFRRVMVFDAY